MECIITCPHCSDYIIIKKINCGIFNPNFRLYSNSINNILC